jgi:hypothetical protein
MLGVMYNLKKLKKKKAGPTCTSMQKQIFDRSRKGNWTSAYKILSMLSVKTLLGRFFLVFI